MHYVLFGVIVGLHLFAIIQGPLPLWTLVGTLAVISPLAAALSTITVVQPLQLGLAKIIFGLMR